MHRILPGVLALVVFSLAFAAPASAVNGTEFVLFAQKRIGFESGATVINGNGFPSEILLEAIVRHAEERLLAMPRQSLESALRPRDQAWRRGASADVEPLPTAIAPLARAWGSVESDRCDGHVPQ